MCMYKYIYPSRGAARFLDWIFGGWGGTVSTYIVYVFMYVGVASLRMDVGSVWVYFGCTYVHPLYDTYTVYIPAYTGCLPPHRLNHG